MRAGVFNRRLLAHSMTEVEMNPTYEEVNSYYRQVVDKENFQKSKTEREIELQQARIDSEVSQDGFVTCQSIRSFRTRISVPFTATIVRQNTTSRHS